MQLVRERPPGFGGVERVAHGLAAELGGCVYFMRQPCAKEPEPLGVSYRRHALPALTAGKVLLPLASFNLLRLLGSRQPLLVHLPCPTVLVLLVLARLIHPRRVLWVYWHAFLAPKSGLGGSMERLYQRLALRVVRSMEVITTSPALLAALESEGVERLHLLPCALPAETETACTRLWQQRVPQRQHATASVIAIARLDSYKRIDWLINAVAASPAVRNLQVIGDGPDRTRLEALARSSLRPDQQAVFHGRLGEAAKLQQLALATVLVLPADRCNEAFGIVQLEAMACGIPAIAFDLPRSGMHWVSALPALGWSGKPSELTAILQRLLVSKELQQQASTQARERYDAHFALKRWRRDLHALIDRV
jgi:glycosyltransferase involved in cell wall biosynthesis